LFSRRSGSVNLLGCGQWPGALTGSLSSVVTMPPFALALVGCDIVDSHVSAPVGWNVRLHRAHTTNDDLAGLEQLADRGVNGDTAEQFAVEPSLRRSRRELEVRGARSDLRTWSSPICWS
jgi:hypothetical protein